MGPWCADYFINHYTEVIKERKEQHLLYVTLSLADLQALVDRIKEDQWITGQLKGQRANESAGK